MTDVDLLAKVVQASGRGEGPIIIHHGDQKIGPRLAARILKECSFAAQAKRTKSGVLGIARHAENMRRGLWIDNSQIHFCRLGSYQFVLVNGYHRLNAVIKYGSDVSFNIVMIDCDVENDVASVYARFDRPLLHRARSDDQALSAIGFAETLGVIRGVARALYRAIPLIRNEMRAIRNTDIETKVEMAIFEVRADAANNWSKEILLLDEICRLAGGELKRKLLNPATTAVILQTIKHSEVKAHEFWSRVARNDGLRVLSPEHTLVNALLSRRQFGGDNINFLIPALAWNAFYEGRTIRTIQAGAAGELRIAGTPIGKRGQR